MAATSYCPCLKALVASWSEAAVGYNPSTITCIVKPMFYLKKEIKNTQKNIKEHNCGKKNISGLPELCLWEL